MSGLSFLKKLRQVVPTGSMRYQLHQHLTGKSTARPLSRVHASALTRPEGLCPRYYALHDIEKTQPQDEWITTSEVVTYDIGHDLQDRIVHHFADMGRCVGDWRCYACHHIHDFQPRPVQCHCGCHTFKPVEVRFKSLLNGADCGIDMLRIVGPNTLRVTEIKTMDKDQFKQLIGPLSEHKDRTNLYLRIIAESGYNADAKTLDVPWQIETERAEILYVSKGGFGVQDTELTAWGLSDHFSPFKEYVVARNDTKSEPYTDRALVVKLFRDGVVGMPCGLCATAKSKRAQYCDRRTVCFSGKYPVAFDWTKP